MPAGRAGAMPPGGPRLPDDKLDVLKRWIEQGAAWPEGVTLKATGRGRGDEREIVRRFTIAIARKQPASSNPTR